MINEIVLTKRSTSFKFYVGVPKEYNSSTERSPAKSDNKESTNLRLSKKVQTFQTSCCYLKESLCTESETSSISQNKSHRTDSKQISNCQDLFERLVFSNIGTGKQNSEVNIKDKIDAKSNIQSNKSRATIDLPKYKSNLKLKLKTEEESTNNVSDLTKLFMTRTNKHSKTSKQSNESKSFNLGNVGFKLNHRLGLSCNGNETTNLYSYNCLSNISKSKQQGSNRKLSCSLDIEAYPKEDGQTQKTINKKSNMTFEDNNSEFLNTKLGDFHSERDQSILNYDDSYNGNEQHLNINPHL